jgi:hypothetical protein
MFRRNIALSIADFASVDGWKSKNPINRRDVSAKHRLPIDFQHK